MTRSTFLRDRLAWLAISSLALASSACNGPGMTAPWRRSSTDDVYIAQRPPFDASGRKNFYVSGYAGATYGPIFQNRARPRVSALPDVSEGQPRTVIEEGDWPVPAQ